MERNKIQVEWKDRGYTFGVYNDPPGHRWENYVHESDELFMVAEGKVEVQLGKKKWSPKVGEEILIPAGQKHSVRNVGRMTSKWFYGYKH